jgi:ribosomal protein S18 acetylase RimI-like enzyme
MTAQNGSTSPIIRTVTNQDKKIVRDVILQMLADSPFAFGDTLAEAQNRTDEEWNTFMEQITNPATGHALLALDQAGLCGFVCADLANPQSPPGTAVVSRLWVHPRCRGTGLGRNLMEIISKWVLQNGTDQIGLGVTEMNKEVFKFYEHLGYIDLGIRFPWPPDPSKQIIVMGRNLKVGL